MTVSKREAVCFTSSEAKDLRCTLAVRLEQDFEEDEKKNDRSMSDWSMWSTFDESENMRRPRTVSSCVTEEVSLTRRQVVAQYPKILACNSIEEDPDDLLLQRVVSPCPTITQTDSTSLSFFDNDILLQSVDDTDKFSTSLPPRTLSFRYSNPQEDNDTPTPTHKE